MLTGLLTFIIAIQGYYDGMTELYEYDWAKSFHFSCFYKGESFAAFLAHHEHYLAAQMNLRSGMKVLDVGCVELADPRARSRISQMLRSSD
jgi:hypothetical protein